ncbi:MAG: hypothetical protein MJA31_09205 [Clostridia bacterium]|nr:hypothetical protein [Clostridia bacterium]
METYEDLEYTIDFKKKRKRQYEKEKERLNQLCCQVKEVKSAAYDVSGIKSEQSFISFEDYLQRIREIDENITKCQKMINLLLAQKREINKKLSRFTGKKHRIFYLYRVERKTFEEIAVQLDLSERHVRRLYKEIVRSGPRA